MLREILKEKTFSAHQKTERIVIHCVKKIQSEADYIDLLKCFYAYFHAVEHRIFCFVDESVLPDLKSRRNSGDIKKDIEGLGGTTADLPAVSVPEVNNTLEALSALYVLEGSVMGGPYIVKMLQKRGITHGFSFFEGYGDKSPEMFDAFIRVLEAYAGSASPADAVEAANQTFSNFGEVFKTPAPLTIAN